MLLRRSFLGLLSLLALARPAVARDDAYEVVCLAHTAGGSPWIVGAEIASADQVLAVMNKYAQQWYDEGKNAAAECGGVFDCDSPRLYPTETILVANGGEELFLAACRKI